MQLSGFGYKNSWFAMRTECVADVTSLLGLIPVEQCEWNLGIEKSYDFKNKLIFQSPVLNGWTFLVGTPLFRYAENGSLEAIMERLCKALASDVYYYATHRVDEFHAWARYSPDSPVRMYAYNGSRGETLLDVGGRSKEEIELGLAYFDERSPEAKTDGYWEREDLRFPNENDVLALAGMWSIDPGSFEDREVSELPVGQLLKLDVSEVPPPQPARKPWWRLW